MIKFFSIHISNMLLSENIIDKRKMPYYKYGIELLISSLLSLIIAISIGTILNCIFETIAYLVIFVTFRQICGGWHAKHYWTCNLTFFITTLFVLGLYKVILLNKSYICFHYIVLLFSILVVFIFAPQDSENKPLNKLQRKKFGIISKIAIIIIATISCYLYMLKSKYAILIDLTLITITIPLMISGIQKGGKNHE